MNMENLLVEKAECFGWHFPKKDCWWYIINSSISKGWYGIDVKKAELSLKSNVDVSYKSLATFTIKDLDTDTTYIIWFDNQKKLWDVKISMSKKADVLPEERKEIFKSELFKNTCKRANEILMRSLEQYNEIVKNHIEKGDLINVDEIKIEAIEHMLNDSEMMRSLRLGKFVKK